MQESCPRGRSAPPTRRRPVGSGSHARRFLWGDTRSLWTPGTPRRHRLHFFSPASPPAQAEHSVLSTWPSLEAEAS